MSFNTSALSNYTKQNADKLITGVVTGAITAARIKAKGNVRVNIKTKDQIGKMDTDAIYQDGKNCGFSASGSTAISAREIEVGSIKVNEALCMADLEDKFTQQALPAGSDYTEAVYAQEYTDKKIAVINSQNEKAIWKGDKNSGTHYLNKFDGFLKIIDADPTVIVANARKGTGTVTAATNSTALTGSGTSFTTEIAAGDKIYNGSTLVGTIASVTDNTNAVLTANASSAITAGAFNYMQAASPFLSAPITADISKSNVLAIMDGVYLAIPDAVMEDVVNPPVVWLGTDISKYIKLALKDANLYHFAPQENPMASFKMPGLDIEIQPTPGLTATGRIIVMQDGNQFLGTDLLDEENKVELKYADEAEEMRFRARWKMGVQYGIGAQVVSYKKLA